VICAEAEKPADSPLLSQALFFRRKAHPESMIKQTLNFTGARKQAFRKARRFGAHCFSCTIE